MTTASPSKTTDATYQRYELANLIDCPNELLSEVKQANGYLFFHDTRMPNALWYVSLTATGRIRKNSLRHDR